jgi:hypothetical protein
VPARFSLTTEAHAALFRTRAIEIVGDLVEPSEPPKGE